MKKLRLHIYIILGLFVALFIVGTFLDLNFSEAIFHKNNGFGLFVSVIGTLPGYSLFGFFAGGFLVFALSKEKAVWFRVVSWVLIAALVGLGTYFAGREFFGENGFYNENLNKWLGFLIALPFQGLFGWAGYKITKQCDNDKIWILYVILMIAVFMSLVPGVTLLKEIFHRPRFRMLAENPEINFRHWYERCANYKELMQLYDISKEEFKSFPSGHTAAAALMIFVPAFVPVINHKYNKYMIPLFYVGVAWTLLIAFVRIFVGAHFLSDVSMGGILASVMFLIANEVIIHNKYLHPQE